VITGLCLAANASASLSGFLDGVFLEFQVEYAAYTAEEYQELCNRHDLELSDSTNHELFLRISFLHDLLTTVNASDCVRGGFLQIPYFWHWIEPNPRHEIISLPDSTALVKLEPASRYNRYATRADIDRVPSLFFADLRTEEPGYYHPDCGLFYTFGWCSEREMAFTALATAWGLTGKITQSGIHTHSSVCCEFRLKGGSTGRLVADVDNTYDTISWQEMPDSVSIEMWLRQTGTGTQIDWYNRQARSREQIEALGTLSVGEGAGSRIRELIRTAFQHENQ